MDNDNKIIMYDYFFNHFISEQKFPISNKARLEKSIEMFKTKALSPSRLITHGAIKPIVVFSSIQVGEPLLRLIEPR